jgi:hypothetical protein
VLFGGMAGRFAFQRSWQGDCEECQQDDRDHQRDGVFVRRRGRVHVGRQRWHHHRGDREQHQHSGGARPLRADALGAMAQASDGEGRSEYQQQIGEDRTDQRGLHHHHQTGFQCEQCNEQFRQVCCPTNIFRHSGRTHEVGEIRNLLSITHKTAADSGFPRRQVGAGPGMTM